MFKHKPVRFYEHHYGNYWNKTKNVKVKLQVDVQTVTVQLYSKESLTVTFQVRVPFHTAFS